MEKINQASKSDFRITRNKDEVTWDEDCEKKKLFEA